MHGAAVQFAASVPRGEEFDVLLTTDMVDLATLRGLRPDLARLPSVTYFHENQISYPWSPSDQDVSHQFDRRYGWINYTTALASEQCWFASEYHLQVWSQALPEFLRVFPKGRKLPLPQSDKYHVYPLPLELNFLITSKRPTREPPSAHTPTIVWNHRWEHDKNPTDFFAVVDQLAAEHWDFQLIVLGKRYARAPAVFAKAKQAHQHRILHWGYADSRSEYEAWLLRSDIALVTSKHDYFGIAVVEAIAAGAAPVLPRYLDNLELEAPYAAHVSPENWAAARYEDRAACLAKMRGLLSAWNVSASGDPACEQRRRYVMKYDAKSVVSTHDAALLRLYSSRLSS